MFVITFVEVNRCILIHVLCIHELVSMQIRCIRVCVCVCVALAQLGVPDETVQLLKSFQEEQTSSLIGYS